ncbi:MAG TPA: FkbM family methyltransferase [Dokdonella sp.]
MNELERLRRVWQTLGRDDPLWAVLSRADKRGGRWRVDEFLATGRVEVDSQLAALAAHGLPRRHELALDFGCGAGRLSRALAAHFAHVIGVDVSASMLATARALNADLANLEFRENASPRLAGVADASVDFVFSHLTLQHIPTALAAGYVDEFFRVLAPGGAAVFQFVCAADDSLRGRLFGAAPNRWLNPLRRVAWRRRDVFEMHVLPEPALRERLARRPHLRLFAEFDDGAAGPGWRGRRWVVVNDAEPPERTDRAGHALYAYASDVHVGAPVLAGREHDAHVQAVLRERLRPGDTMLDVGANVGVMTMLAARCVGPRGRVVAVEPIARNRVLLERAAQANGFGWVETVAAAASDRAGEIVLRTHPTTSNAARPAAAGERLLDASGADARVPAVALDDVLGALERLDLVKIDAEGMEPLVVRGLARTLERFRPVLVSEFHPWAIERAAGEPPLDGVRRLLRLYPEAAVLHRDGTRERLADADALLELWRREDARAGGGGRLHLDLLFAPDAAA